ncbi:hypothetical protein AB205_0083700 [Aquarana catesbeiana]|uniref:Cadherin domain-containing protein n=1 Tax=Aquarana catesbeiana TaxID=8400 RepID=A0A2G9S8V9_AQUCT|nr:hypothetical protein AB205_0083700 [Aquarana catesbeiana]
MQEEDDNRPRNPIAKVHSDLEVKKGTILYRITGQGVDQPPFNVFIMDPRTGYLNVTDARIDREQTPFLYSYSAYSLYVSGSDLNGAAGALSGQCGADIKILDVNDNFPVLEFDSYSVNFAENMIGLTDLRMKVFDADEMYTDNWIAVFEIVSGNEGGWFVIDTDAQTNEGILRIVKALDYESMKMANLAILVTNRAAFHYSVMSEYQAKMTSINVQVQNEIEGPVFIPNNIQLTIPQGLSQEELLQYVLGKVTAINQETGQAATNVVYSLDSTSSRWFIIDSTTGEIKMTLDMARGNGPVAPNGTFTGTIFATDDNLPTRPGSTNFLVDMAPVAPVTPESIGACPTITTEPRVVCRGYGKAIIKATQNPSNTPFTITLSPNPGWSTEPLNGPAVGPGNYTVRVSVSDKNNVACPNPVDITITVCECTSGGSCDATKLWLFSYYHCVYVELQLELGHNLFLLLLDMKVLVISGELRVQNLKMWI